MHISDEIKDSFTSAHTGTLPMRYLWGKIMLDQLLDIVREQAEDKIVRNPDIDDRHNEGAIQDAMATISQGLLGRIAEGGLEDVLDIFSQKSSNTANPLVGKITEQFTQQLGAKYNLSSDKAGGIAGSLIPIIIDRFVNRTNDNGVSGIDLNSVFGMLTGDKDGKIDFGDVMNRFDKREEDDGFGLDDVMDMVRGNQGGQGGGLLGGLLGK